MTALHVPETLLLTTGEARPVELPGAGSAGYRWSASTINGADVVEVTIGLLPPPPAMPGDLPVTFSASEQAMFTGLRHGQAVVRLILARPWEADLKPRQEITIQIQVN